MMDPITLPESLALDGVEYKTEEMSEMAKFCLSDLIYLEETVKFAQRDLDLLEAGKEKLVQLLEAELG